MFPGFEITFWVIFVLALAMIVFSWIIRIIKTGKEVRGQATSENKVVIREKEIIREIVKIRCQYCGNLYDETLDKCPHCGGKRL